MFLLCLQCELNVLIQCTLNTYIRLISAEKCFVFTATFYDNADSQLGVILPASHPHQGSLALSGDIFHGIRMLINFLQEARWPHSEEFSRCNVISAGIEKLCLRRAEPCADIIRGTFYKRFHGLQKVHFLRVKYASKLQRCCSSASPALERVC